MISVLSKCATELHQNLRFPDCRSRTTANVQRCAQIFADAEFKKNIFEGRKVPGLAIFQSVDSNRKNLELNVLL